MILTSKHQTSKISMKDFCREEIKIKMNDKIKLTGYIGNMMLSCSPKESSLCHTTIYQILGIMTTSLVEINKILYDRLFQIYL